METGAVTIQRYVLGRGHLRFRDADDLRSGGGGARHYGLSPSLPAARRRPQRRLHSVGGRQAQIILDLAIGCAERHVDHVDGIFDRAVVVGIEREVDPFQNATPLHAVETELQTLTAYNFAPGATPRCVPSVLLAAGMSAVWVP